ncbi:hypothetical protein [Carnobacterium pleistocenium]|uniref:hypothetical protein n=1 Tax=Carnobacterium pleistocenium TaxID=181073 RepID=UPI00068B7E5C|nr:hypothetical protein [Carnobacterium pleistocenium]
MLIGKKLISTVFTSTILALTLSPIFSYAATDEKTIDETEKTVQTVEMKAAINTEVIIDVSSLKVSKTSATLGDTIKISLAAENPADIDYIDISYVAPLSKYQSNFTLKLNKQTDLFEVEIEVDKEFENGTWIFDGIYATDLEGNTVYSEKFDSLTAGNFLISGIRSEINLPQFDYESLEVSKKIVTEGNTVTISAKITDDSNLEKVSLGYFYGEDLTDESYFNIDMVYNSKTDRYEASFLIDDESYIGSWRITSISAKDSNQNYMQWFNGVFWQENGPDLTAGEFEVITNTEKAAVSYLTHVQSKGWMDKVADGALSGTKGESKRMEAVKITVDNNPDLGITYSTHVEKNGWMNWVSDGTLSGTSGEAKRLEAIKIKLTGTDAEKYDVYYRVHAEKNGWLGWAKNGEEAGTEGYSRRLEAIEIVIVEKGAAAPGSTAKPFDKKEKVPTVSYTTHVQSIGWQAWVKDGTMAGTSGKAKRLEGIKINLENLTVSGNIQYKTHVQSYGWQGWSTNGSLSGTSGKAKRLEAVQIQLTGEMAKKYDVYYRVHAQSYGWLGWAKNGESSGTEGKAKRLEGVEIKLVEKGEQAPTSKVNSFIK